MAGLLFVVGLRPNALYGFAPRSPAICGRLVWRDGASRWLATLTAPHAAQMKPFGARLGLPDRRGPFAGCYHLMSGNSFIERLQAARHSTLLMCVAASQKPMQSASDLPPPPGLLGADWLGLSLPDDVLGGERASEEPPEEPPPVAKLLGKGSDMGDSGATVDPGCCVVGVVVAATPAGGVSPAEGVDDPPEGVDDDDVDDVDGAAGVVEPGDALGVVVVREVVVGAEKLGTARDTGALPADERACANAASGNSSKRVMAASTGGLGESIAITMGCRQCPSLVTIGATFAEFTIWRATEYLDAL
jgi:hypothetical protein